jgi:hypothetical protein
MAKTEWSEDLLLFVELTYFFTVKDKDRKMVFEADGKIPAKTYHPLKTAQKNDFEEIYEREFKKLGLEENPKNIKYGIDTIIEETQYKIKRHKLLTPDVKNRSHNLIRKAEGFIQFLNDMDKKPEAINTDEVKEKKEFKDFFIDKENIQIINKIQQKFKEYHNKKMAFMVYILHIELKLISYSVNSRDMSRKHFVSELKGCKVNMQGINKYFALNDVKLDIPDFKNDNDFKTIQTEINSILQPN